MAKMLETYLGDGAYAEFDGYGITLYTSDGISRTNTIYFEPEVYEAFEAFMNIVQAFVDETRKREAGESDE